MIFLNLLSGSFFAKNRSMGPDMHFFKTNKKTGIKHKAMAADNAGVIIIPMGAF